MKITVLPPDQLTAAHLEAWSRWQRADAAVDSPFFRPELTQAVAAVRGDVEVAVLEEDGAPAGFFPYQRGSWGIGRPVGGRLSDFQGVISRPGLQWRAADLVRGCRLRAWDFDHLLASQVAFRPFHAGTGGSPFMDLSSGFDAYLAERSRAGSQLPQQARGKVRKAIKEVGPMRFELHSADPEVFRALTAWKSAQYRRTKAPDVFAFPWTQELLQRILAASGEGFAGWLSSLSFDGRLAAVHLGIRSFGVLHWWFTAYDPELGAYSPGLILLLELARAAAAAGVRRLDLGKGEADYKLRFMSGAIALAEGSVATDPLVRLLRHGWHRTRTWMRSSVLGGPVRVAGRWTRSLRGWLAFR